MDSERFDIKEDRISVCIRHVQIASEMRISCQNEVVNFHLRVVGYNTGILMIVVEI